MDRRGFLHGLFGITAAAGALTLGAEQAGAAIVSPAPLPGLAQPPAPAAAVLNDSDMEGAKTEEARWVWVRRRRYRRYRIIRRRRVFYRRRRVFYRRRRRYYYPY